MRWFTLFDIGGIRDHLKRVTGYHIKQTYLLCRAPYSQAVRSASAGSSEPVDVNLGLYTHCEAELWMGLEFGYHPPYLSGSLQRRLRVSKVYDNVKKCTWVDT